MSQQRFIYTPKERPPVILRVSGLLFCIGVIFLWLMRKKFDIKLGNLMILTGIAVLLISLSILGKRVEKKLKATSDAIRHMSEKCGKDDYNSDIFFK